MALRAHEKANFKTLQQAALHGDLALIECQDARTHRPVAVQCAVNHARDTSELVPLARLFAGNPYRELISPIAGGG